MAERPPVKRLVAGSSPAGSAPPRPGAEGRQVKQPRVPGGPAADSTTNPTTTEDEQPGAEVTEEQGTEQAQETNEEEQTEEREDESPESQLPEWAQKELTKARQEAARYRTSLRDAEKKLSEAKTQEDIDAAVAEVRQAQADIERDLHVERALRAHGLTDEDREFFDGLYDVEAITARAEKLAARTSRSNDEDDIDDLRGGLNPGRRRHDAEVTPEWVNKIRP